MTPVARSIYLDPQSVEPDIKQLVSHEMKYSLAFWQSPMDS